MAPTGREAGYPLGFGTGRETLEPPPPSPEESGDGQWPGFSLRRGGPRPSAPRHRGSMVQRVPPLSERRHRPRPNTPAPLASSKSRPLPRESSATMPPGGPATTSTPTFVDHHSRTTAKTNVPTSAYYQFGYVSVVSSTGSSRLPSVFSRGFDPFPAVDWEVGSS